MFREYFNRIIIIKISFTEITKIINKSKLYIDDNDGNNDNHPIDHNKSKGNIKDNEKRIIFYL